jgi:stage III sporulation protein AH
MKKFAGKNQMIITALAVMIAVAGYLNFTGQEIDENGLTATSVLTGETAKSQDGETEQTEEAANDPDSEEVAQNDETQGDDTKTDDDEVEADGTQSASEDDAEYTVADQGELTPVSEENPGEAVMVSNQLSADYFTSAKLSREQSRAQNKETLMKIIDNDKIASKDKKSAIKQVAQLTKNAQLESAAELMLEAKGFTDAVVSIEKKSADVIINAQNLTEQQLAQITDIVTRKTGIAAENIVITPVSVDTTTETSTDATTETSAESE